MRRLAVFGLLTSIAGCNVGLGGSSDGNGGSGAAGTGGTAGGLGGSSGMAGAAPGTGGGGSSGGHTNPLAQNVIDAFVAAHNQARSGPLTPTPSPPLPPVSWDAILADSVYDYAIECHGTNGLLSHNADRSTDYQALGGSGYVGENIYGSSGTGATPDDAVSLWMSEASSYDYASGDIGSAGHYTQIVWRDSVRIGCAIVDCPALTYHNTVICDYAPGGNISGQKPY
jgi:pathogenesis-related protein 1